MGRRGQFIRDAHSRLLTVFPRQAKPETPFGRNIVDVEQPEIGVAQGRVMHRNGVGDFQIIADAQIGHPQAGGEHPVKHGLFKLILAPQNLELRVLQHVDHAAAAMDAQCVHLCITRCRVPRDGDIADLQCLRIEDPHHLALVGLRGVVSQVDLRILPAEENRALRVGGHVQRL